MSYKQYAERKSLGKKHHYHQNLTMSLDILPTKLKAGVPIKYNFITQVFLPHDKFFAKQIQPKTF